MRERILAVDPGKVTGWMVANTDDLRHVQAGEDPHLGFLDRAWRAIQRRSLDVVVVEDFVITQRTLKITRGENWSLEQIGVLRWLCHRKEIAFDDSQTAAAAKRFATDAKLRQVGWYQPTKGGHRNDAARHLLLYLARTERLEEALS